MVSAAGAAEHSVRTAGYRREGAENLARRLMKERRERVSRFDERESVRAALAMAVASHAAAGKLVL